MQYLARQYSRAIRAKKRNIPLEDAFAVKYYVQKRMAETITKYIRRGARVLEVGCGGSLAIHLLSRAGFECYAIDIDEMSLAFSRLLQQYFHTKVTLKQGDAFKIPYKNRYFDYVFSVGLIEHYQVPDQLRVLNEMLRCSNRIVHLEVPSYSEMGAFYPIYQAKMGTHHPCSLSHLAERIDAQVLEYDGRCVFPRWSLVKKNPHLMAFMRTLGYVGKSRYRAGDITRLCQLEDSLSVSERTRHGYQVFCVMRKKEASP